ncbi:MAG TPA: site-2 protease family protein, partial [Candidatus Saccharimonadales bacterium]|nr:site-2 protease family protein [Candidatus Saccharimonadales bacterium]
MQILLFVFGFLLFIGLILIHEWGHFIAARRNGVAVEEFGLGLPPRAWRKKIKSGVVISLNWLPLGGFVKLKGEHDSDDRPGSFGAASLLAKTKIMLAGVAANLLAGLLLLTIVALMGMPKLIDNQFQVASDAKIVHQKLVVVETNTDSPAQKAGLAPRDIIEQLSFSGQTYAINSPNDLQAATKQLAGQTVEIGLKRSGKTQTKTATLMN